MIVRWTLDAPAPHGGQPVLVAGEPLPTARAALVLLHGRGATAAGILDLATRLALGPEAKGSGTPAAAGGSWPVAAIAPQAAGQTWYPYSFLTPMALNEPDLSAALAALAGLVARLEAGGVPASRTLIAGFSQGACLGLEFVARNARRYGGVAGLSGGLIGPDGTSRSYQGSLDGTPVLLSCGEHDPHIPRSRVVETADVLRGMGALVSLRLDPLLGHTVDDQEISAVRDMLAALIKE